MQKVISNTYASGCSSIAGKTWSSWSKHMIRLQSSVSSLFPRLRISYTKAIEMLIDPAEKLQIKVEWGIDLASEHERYLTEVIFKKPVIVYSCPIGIKAFYMRLNDDQKTGCYGFTCSQGYWMPICYNSKENAIIDISCDHGCTAAGKIPLARRKGKQEPV